MKKMFLFSVLILIIFLSVACRSSPNTSASSPGSSSSASQNVTTNTQVSVGTTSPATPAISTPGATTTTTTAPGTESGASYGTVTGTVSGSTGTLSGRHQSGIILDGAATYTVRRGDTLSRIARQLYQDGGYYPLIMMVNNAVTDPDFILPDANLTIPDLRTNLNDPQARQSISNYFQQIANIEDQRGRRETAAHIRSLVR